MLLPAMLLGCRKKNNSDNTGNNPGANEFAYSVSFDSVSQTPAGGGYNFSFYVKVKKGDINTNKLTCSIEGLPAAATVTPASMTVSSLLGGVFYFDVSTLTAGDYPFRLRVSSAKYGDEYYDAVLRLSAPFDFATLLAGNYDSSYDFCALSALTKYQCTVSAVTDTPYLLKITNFQHLGSDVVLRAWVSDVIAIPEQSIPGGKTIRGTGTFSQDARPGHEAHYLMAVTDTITTGTSEDICTTHIEH